MSKRFRGTDNTSGRSQVSKLCVLLALAFVPVSVASADESATDTLSTNQPVVTEVMNLGPLQFVEDEPSQRFATQTHNAPQEAASLGSPGQSLGSSSTGGREQSEQRAEQTSRLSPGSKDVIQVIGALAVVIALLLLIRLAIMRMSGSSGAGRPSGVVEILARYPVARGQQLILLKLARRVLLVHQNGSTMATLSEVVDEQEVAALLARVEAATAKRDGGFKAVFGRFASDFDAELGSAVASSEQAEIVDLTRRPGSLRNLFTGKGVAR